MRLDLVGNRALEAFDIQGAIVPHWLGASALTKTPPASHTVTKQSGTNFPAARAFVPGARVPGSAPDPAAKGPGPGPLAGGPWAQDPGPTGPCPGPLPGGFRQPRAA